MSLSHQNFKLWIDHEDVSDLVEDFSFSWGQIGEALYEITFCNATVYRYLGMVLFLCFSEGNKRWSGWVLFSREYETDSWGATSVIVQCLPDFVTTKIGGGYSSPFKVRDENTNKRKWYAFAPGKLYPELIGTT